MKILSTLPSSIIITYGLDILLSVVSAGFGFSASVFFAKGLALSTAKSIFEQSLAKLSFNPDLLRALIQQKVDYKIGVYLLIIALIFQLSSNLSSSFSIRLEANDFLNVLLILASVLFWGVTIPFLLVENLVLKFEKMVQFAKLQHWIENMDRVVAEGKNDKIAKLKGIYNAFLKGVETMVNEDTLRNMSPEQIVDYVAQIINYRLSNELKNTLRYLQL